VFGKRWKIFELFGFTVQLDASWLVLALLVTWSLATGVFPQYYPDLPSATYWSMGLVGMIGLVFSIVSHEASHSLVARAHGMQIKGITLFIFGGVAELGDEPETARTEFLVAIAGPISSFLLAAAFFLLAWALDTLEFAVALQGLGYYLAYINTLLATFNLLPAFPLDGGRVLRAALWYWKGDLGWATWISTRSGGVLGFALIGLGVLSIVAGNFVGGLWWFLIGLFVRQAADASFMQYLAREAFAGVPVGRFMTPDPVTVPSTATLRAFVDGYVYRYHYDLYPVTREGRLVGWVRTHDVKAVVPETWGVHAVSEIMRPLTPELTIAPGADALQAVAQMRRSGNSRLLVTEAGRLVGVIVLKDMLELITLRMDLERPD
jgi:Zn-dependent protease